MGEFEVRNRGERRESQRMGARARKKAGVIYVYCRKSTGDYYYSKAQTNDRLITKVYDEDDAFNIVQDRNKSRKL